jgi:hypothetical protein
MDAMKDELRPYLDQLEALPFVKRARVVATSKKAATLSAGVVIALTTTAGETRLPAELKRSHLSREVAEHLVSVGSRKPGLLVLAPVVGSQLGELIAREALNFMDLAGNCHVRIGDTFLARIQGQRSPQREPSDKSLRAPAFSVLFALLVDQTLVQATTRALAQAAGSVSPQTAADMRAKLIAAGIAFKTKSGFRWAPAGRKQLLDMFLSSYPHLVAGFRIGRFRAKQRDVEQLEAELASRLDTLGEWRWGGGAAAQRLTKYYRGDRTIVYLREGSAAVAPRLQLVPDSRGDVVLMRPMGPLVFDAPDPKVVHPLLVYADLLNEGHDRARDAAGEVFRRYLQSFEHAPNLKFVVIGAAAVGHHVKLERPTADVDLAFAIGVDDLSKLLETLGWRRDPRMLQRWRGPDGFVADALPASAELIRAGSVRLDEDDFELSLVGFDLALDHAVAMSASCLRACSSRHEKERVCFGKRKSTRPRPALLGVSNSSPTGTFSKES